MRPVRLLIVALGLLEAAAAAADAQQFGQWSWEGAVGASGRSYRNLLDGAQVSSLDERDLLASVGVAGFVVHPAIARFRLGVDATFSRYRGGRPFDTTRWGFSANVSALPRSRFPTTLYATRQRYSYSRLAEEDPLSLVAVPDTSTALGGRLRARAGPLGGTLLGFDRTSLGYEPPIARKGITQTAFVDWSRSGGTFQRRLRLEHRLQDFATVDYVLRDLTASYDHRGPVGRAWRWEMTGSGIRRGLEFQGRSSSFDSASLNQSALRRLGEGDLSLTYGGALAGGGGRWSQTHSLGGRYQWRPSAAWTVGPLLGFTMQRAPGSAVDAPQVGVAATWTRRGRSLEVTVSDALSYVSIHQRGDTAGTSATLALDLGATLAHGSEGGLRKEVGLSWAHNRLRMAGEILRELPDLGASLTATGTEDRYQARLTLRRRWRSLLFYGQSEAARRDPARLSPGAVGVTTFSHTLQASGRALTLTGNIGGSRVRTAPAQSLDYRAASLAWRPFRLASISATYRTDTRNFVLAPKVDAERAEGGLDLWVGAFVVRATAFATDERSPLVAERSNRGFTVTVSRRFGGWLPIVTGVPTGGVIR